MYPAEEPSISGVFEAGGGTCVLLVTGRLVLVGCLDLRRKSWCPAVSTLCVLLGVQVPSWQWLCSRHHGEQESPGSLEKFKG